MSASRLLRIVLMLAMLLMPLGMISGGAASAQPASQAMADHCAGLHPQPKGTPPGHSASCLLACAAIPACGVVFERDPLPRVALQPAPVPAVPGLHPEAATPPPRLS